jgi:hypothetical protein
MKQFYSMAVLKCAQRLTTTSESRKSRTHQGIYRISQILDFIFGFNVNTQMCLMKCGNSESDTYLVSPDIGFAALEYPTITVYYDTTTVQKKTEVLVYNAVQGCHSPIYFPEPIYHMTNLNYVTVMQHIQLV